MPKHRKSTLVRCRYFSWLISQRGRVWSADGRSNEVNVGRHSLGTYDINEAMQVVHDLDEQIAIKLGKLAKRAPISKEGFTILEAIDRFRENKKRPLSVGGVEPQTLNRYERILNKFQNFIVARNVRFASEINQELFDEYVSALEDKDFARTTIVTEMVLLKSLHQFCIDEKLLDPKFGFKYPLRRPNVSLTYCPTKEEVDEISRICKTDPSLNWLYRVVSVLSNTGLRFGEARDLEWRDIDQKYAFIKVRDESYLNGDADREFRTTKTRKSRTIPIQSSLRMVLGRVSIR